MWYRKTFSLPAAWSSSVSSDGEGSSVWLEFDGVFHACVVYLNGVVVARNAEGYLGFRVPLTNATGSLRSGGGEPNVLAVFVDPDGGAGFSQLNRSGWWYEGAGIYRHSRIVRTASLQIGKDGLVARSSIRWLINSTAEDAVAKSAKLTVAATILNTGAGIAPAGSFLTFTLVEASTGKVVGTVHVSD
jgi:beta-galactosidase